MISVTKSNKRFILLILSIIAIFTSAFLLRHDDLTAIVTISEQFLHCITHGQAFSFIDYSYMQAIELYENSAAYYPSYNVFCYLIVAIWILPFELISHFIVELPLIVILYWTKVLIAFLQKRLAKNMLFFMQELFL